MNIDGKNLRLGRMATVVAKKAMLGEEVNIFNCKDIVVTGNKKTILAEARRKREMGTHSTGPFHHRVPFKYVKRSIRGMLPYKKDKGRKAFERIKCYDNVPEEFKDAKLEILKDAHVESSLVSKYITVGRICKFMGGKIE